MIKPVVTFEQWLLSDLRVGKVIAAKNKEGSDKLLRLTVDFGPEIGERNILAGVAKAFPDGWKLVGKSFAFIVNLPPRKMMGEVSDGMLLCAQSANGETIPFTPVNHYAIVPGESLS